MDEVDIQTSPMGNAAEDLNDGIFLVQILRLWF